MGRKATKGSRYVCIHYHFSLSLMDEHGLCFGWMMPSGHSSASLTMSHSTQPAMISTLICLVIKFGFCVCLSPFTAPRTCKYKMCLAV